QLPRSVRKVEVLGSWDNFTQAYPLERDRQVGSGHWRGCHSFRNITCDGSHLDVTERRDGGLKMGGTYWYYYRLDGEIEHHDPIQPSTTTCPLLPGQHLNVLEVPIQAETADPSESPPQLLDSSVFTMDPNAKYKTPQIPVCQNANPNSAHTFSGASMRSMQPISKVPAVDARICSLPSTASGRPQGVEAHRSNQGRCLAFPSSASLMARIHKLRNSRSASAVEEKAPSSRRGPFKYPWRRSTEDEAEREKRYHDPPARPSNVPTKAPFNSPDWNSTEWDALDWPPVDAQPKYVAPWIADLPDSQSGLNHTARDTSRDLTHTADITTSPQTFPEEGLHDHRAGYQSLSSRAAAQRPPSSSTEAASNPTSSGSGTAVRSVRHHLVGTAPKVNTSAHEAGSIKSQETVNHSDVTARAVSPLVLPIQSNIQPSQVLVQETPTIGHDNDIHRSSQPLSLLSRETLKTFYNTNPTVDGQLSPHYLSQPESPSVRDFEEAWDSDGQSQSASHNVQCEKAPLFGKSSTADGLDLLPMPQLPSPDFQDYKLPEREHASTLTLGKPPNAERTSVPDSTPSDNHQLVHSWNDGSNQRHLTALDELIDDLGYLGQVII
ncbi:MAG: hypothetical protein Q9200_007546, partial [Gallowayella weberi]